MTPSTIRRTYGYSMKGITFDLIFSNRTDGECVLANMRMLILRYGYARVLDLYELAGVVPSSTDPYLDYIWTDLEGASIRATYEGYTIYFSKPMPRRGVFIDGGNDKMYKQKEKAIMAAMMPKIRNVIFNDPATIVFWDDNSKTVVKCSEDDIYNPDAGLAMAICKKLYGNSFKQKFHKWTKKYDAPASSREEA